MKSTTFLTLLLSLYLISATLSLATRPEPEGGGDDNSGMGGFFPPGGGFNIPGFGPGPGGGYGSGFGGPTGGRSKNGIVRGSFVCKDKGLCHKKKLTCPAKCFASYAHAGKGFGYGGGGGGCSFDCQKCRANCS